MKARKRVRRVSLLDSVQGELGYLLARGVQAYAEHAQHWQFTGRGGRPFLGLEDIKQIKVDGVIGDFRRPADADAIPPGVHAVNTSTEANVVGLPRVGTDNTAVGRLGAEYLLGCGFTDLAFFGADDEWHGQLRLEGFVSTIKQAGRACHVLTFQENNPGGFKERARAWLARLPKPVAIMTHMDYAARLLINMAVAMDLRVPDDVAVLGVNNNRWTALMAAVPVSSIELDLYRIGHLAAETLDRLMDGAPVPAPRWLPPVGVVCRRSTDIAILNDPIVTQAMGYIRDHCADGIHVDDVMDQLRISRRNLELRMRRAIGLTPQVAIQRAKIERAKRLLVESQSTIENISHACGFAHPGRLAHVFKRMTGLSTSAYRQRWGKQYE